MTRIKNVRNTTKFKRSIKAISPVIATLLMIAIAVVASLVVYAWVTGYMGNTTSKAGKAIQIQSFAPQSTNLLIYVQNVGQGDVELKRDQSVYVNSNLVPISLPNSAKIQIPVGQTVELAVPLPAGYAQGDKLNIKVTTTDGTFMTATGTGTSSSGGSGVTASITLSQTSGVAGSTVTLSGSNFAATSAITVKFDTTSLTTTPATVTTTAAGAIPLGVSFTIPASALTGAHTITATDASSNYATSTYTVSAANPVATKLAFYSGGAQSLTVNVVSGAIVVQRQDASNNPVSLGTSAITVTLSSSGTGAFYSDAAGMTLLTGSQITIAAGASDSASFYYKGTVVGSGTHTLTGASGSLASATTPFTISAANPVATKLAFYSGGAQSLTVNVVSGAIVVQRQDASNNPVSLGTSAITVTLSSSGTGAFYSDAAGMTLLTGSQITIAAGASDSASFYYKGTVVGSGTHTLTGASGSLASATSAFTVSSPGATKLVFSAGAPQTLTAGVVSPTAIVIQRQDASNNPVSTGAPQITVTLSTGSSGGAFYSNAGGTTLLTGSQITIAAGASDSAVFYYKDTVASAPKVTLTGASGTLTSATSQFTVNAAGASKIVFIVAPTTVVHNVVSTVFTVQIQDAYGNAATRGSTTTVTLSDTTQNHASFYLNSGDTGTITSVSIASGANSASFYWKYTGTTYSTKTITATPNGGLTADTTDIAVT